MSDQASGSTDMAVAGTITGEVARRFAEMAMLVPGEEGDATENILESIMAAASWEQLDEAWKSTDAEALAGVVFRIDRIMRRPSRFRDGLGVFLVVHCMHGKSGERFVWTTSSVATVGQLVRAYCGEWLPIWASVVIADKPTEAGYYPHHLHFYGPDKPGERAA